MPKGFLPDGKSLAVLTSHNLVRLFDAETGQSRIEIQPDQGSYWIDLAIASQAGILAIADRRGSVEIWDVVEPAGTTTK